ncbi:MAG: hypothetical protein JF603_07455 [Acidobacteria bacterium]|nr:hypothetical protein [Acidobacteriota bacterium]
MAEKQKRVSKATRESEQRDAQAEHGAPQVPTADEERAAPKAASPGAAEAYKDYLEQGANHPGEGRTP